MLEIRSLEDTSLAELHVAREAAFAAYVTSWTPAEYERLLQRRGYRPELSFGAFASGTLVSFVLNGIGSFNGLLSAYDTGTGTVPAYQGQGLAGRLLEAALPGLRKAGVQQYVLEVLTDNKPAVRLYQKQDFAHSRTFNYFMQEVPLLQPKPPRFGAPYVIEQLSLTDELIKAMQAMWDFHPSWQNSFEALLRKPDDFVSVGVYLEAELCGYGIIEPASGDIPQLAVRKDMRRRGIGTQIFHALSAHNQSAKTKAVNTDVQCEPLTAFLLRLGYPLSGSQYEMIKALA